MTRNSSGNAPSRKAKRRKHFVPPKPYPDFPLTPHAGGKWMKKINGRLHYFGRWGKRVDGKIERLPGDGWKEALEIYKAQRDDLHAGRTPAVTEKKSKLTVAELCNRFFTAKTRKLEAGELSRRTFQGWTEITDLIVAEFGANTVVEQLAAEDFERLRATMAERWGPVKLANSITQVKSVFKYAYENRLIESPVRYGTEFKKPSRSVLQKHRNDGGKRLFTADEIHRLLDVATVPMRAMILLGVNCGFGNTDVAHLQQSHLDLENGWIEFPRPKNGNERRCHIWPETVEAIQSALAERPEPKDPDDAGCVFLTTRRQRWVRPTSKGHSDNVCLQFSGLLTKLEINGRRGLGFYSLRHTFRTVADGARDQVAANLVMGHADNSMAGNYRHGIDDDRLVAVAEHVRDWLFPADEKTEGGAA